jgi:hypothetical protein
MGHIFLYGTLAIDGGKPHCYLTQRVPNLQRVFSHLDDELWGARHGSRLVTLSVVLGLEGPCIDYSSHSIAVSPTNSKKRKNGGRSFLGEKGGAPAVVTGIKCLSRRRETAAKLRSKESFGKLSSLHRQSKNFVASRAGRCNTY